MAIYFRFWPYCVEKALYIFIFVLYQTVSRHINIGMAIDMPKDEQKASVLNKLKEQTRPKTL
jgi:hypothetical protein